MEYIFPYIYIFILLFFYYLIRKYNTYLPLIKHSIANNQSALKYMNGEINAATMRRLTTIIVYDVIRLSPEVNVFLLERYVRLELKGRYQKGFVRILHTIFRLLRHIISIFIIIQIILFIWGLIK